MGDSYVRNARFLYRTGKSTDLHKGNRDSWDHSPCSSGMATVKDALAKIGLSTFT